MLKGQIVSILKENNKKRINIRQFLKIALQVICGILASSMLLTLEIVNAWGIALYSLNASTLLERFLISFD